LPTDEALRRPADVFTPMAKVCVLMSP
jgi:hypothetical protein